MKDKVFNKMKEYGWNFGDNTSKDFEDIYNTHYDFIQRLHNYFVETDELNVGRDLNDINEQNLQDMITFMGDFLRSLNDRDDYIEKLERGLMSALDELKDNNKDMDYYDKLRELTDMQNFEALDFLDKFSEN